MLLHSAFSLLSCPFYIFFLLTPPVIYRRSLKIPQLCASCHHNDGACPPFESCSSSASLLLPFLTLILTSSGTKWNVAFMFLWWALQEAYFCLFFLVLMLGHLPSLNGPYLVFPCTGCPMAAAAGSAPKFSVVFLLLKMSFQGVSLFSLLFSWISTEVW